MDETVYDYLNSNKELKVFVRHNPIWYRYLSRDPSRINELDEEAKKFYGRTFNQKIKKFNNNVQLLEMYMDLMKEI